MLQRHDQLAGLGDEALEPVMEIESLGGIVFGIDHQGKHGHFGPHGPNGRIGEQCATELLAVQRLVDRETADPSPALYP